MTFKKIFSSRVAQASLGIILAAITAMPTLAQYQYGKKTAQESPRPTPSAARMTQQMSRMVERADREIDKRVTRLNTLSDRIKEMKKITDINKTDLTNTIQGQITTLTNLKAKIAADTDTETVRTDMQSITKAYRIYALVMPQVAIMVAADRVSLVSDALNTVNQKLTNRITAAQAPGNDVAALQLVLSYMTAQITDAKTQAQNAQNEVAHLVPDNGDQTTFDANKQVIKDAHEKIKTAKKDLEAARKYAQDIVKGLKLFATHTTNTPISHLTPTVIPTDSTINWKTYSNDTYGFHFKYPNDWTYETLQNGNEISFSPVGKKFYLEGTKTGVMRVIIRPDVSFSSKNAQVIQVGGKTAYKTKGYENEIVVAFKLNNMLVSLINDVSPVVINSEYKNSADSYNEIFDKILLSVIFTK